MPRGNPRQTPTNYVGMGLVDEFAAKVQALGGTVVGPRQAVPQVGYLAVCLDPDGNAFGLCEDDSQAGQEVFM